jgi:hypothetical protein
MKKWAQKLSRDVKETLAKLDTTEPKFSGTGRRLGDAGPSRPVVPPDAPNPSTSAETKKASPYDAILRSIGKDDHGCVSALATMLEGIDKGKREREETQEILTVLRKILCNVIADPGNDKVRSLRLANAKIDRCVVRPKGARELLMGCGFYELNDTADAVAEPCLVMSRDVARDRLSLMRRVVRVIETLLGIQPEPENASNPAAQVTRVTPKTTEPSETVEVPGDGRRNTVLELPSAVEDADLPDEFYQQSLSELRRLYRHNRELLDQSKVLMTKAMRDKLAGSEKLSKARVRVRVRAPEAIKVVGDFHSYETLHVLFSWVSECLDERIVEFDLVTPPPERRSVGDLRFDAKCTIRDVFGAGDVTLNLVINGGEGVRGGGPTFKVDGLPA